MIINGIEFSKRELEFIEMAEKQEQTSVIKNTMETSYPLNPITIIEKFIRLMEMVFYKPK